MKTNRNIPIGMLNGAKGIFLSPNFTVPLQQNKSGFKLTYAAHVTSCNGVCDEKEKVDKATLKIPICI